MESQIKHFGHPIHPMLIVVLAGLFTSAVTMDILYRKVDNPILPTTTARTAKR